MVDDNIKTVCPYCGVGCGMVLHVENGEIVSVSGDKTHPANFGRLCTKGSSAHLALRHAGRLESAFVRRAREKRLGTDEDVGQPAERDVDCEAERGAPQHPNGSAVRDAARDPSRIGELVPLEMHQAISETARRLRDIVDADGPDAISFYVSGQMSIEAQYLANKLAKGFVGTNNIESNSRLCMASASSGYKLSLGADGPPGSYQDFDRANLFFVIGANMADCHPILFLRLMDRVKSGAKLIVVDPRRNSTADKADLFMQIRPGTDLALLNGLLYLLHRNGHTHADFIATSTSGWEQMPAFLDDYSPGKVADITGIPEADIRTAAQWIGEAPEWMTCWTMGLNQSTHGTWNTNAICNLHLATGKICRPGSGPFSLTGQPNAMGGREMGYMGPGLPGQRSVLVEEDRRFIEDLWKIPQGTLRTEVGRGTVDMFARMSSGEIKACWIICTNPVASIANRQNVIDGLQAAEFVVAQDAFLDTESNAYADVLLPGALWAEAEGVMVNSERNMTLMQKAIDPPGAALPDWKIIALVASEMGYANSFSYASAEDVFAEITQVSNRKTGYDLRGASHAKLRETPLQWPCEPNTRNDRHPIRYINDGVSQDLFKQDDGHRPAVVFPTPHGRGIFFARPHAVPAELPSASFPFVLNPGRLQHQWHTMTKTGKIPMLNKLNPSPFIEIHPDDATSLGVKAKDLVEVRSVRGHAVFPAVVTDRVLPGNCFAPMHWNDVYGEALCINAVTSDAVDPISQQPEFKFCAVALSLAPCTTPPTARTDRDPVAESVASTVTVETSSKREGYVSHLDALASLLGVPANAPPVLSETERLYISGVLQGLRLSGASTHGIPRLPASAPLSAPTRLWLDGVLVGLFSRAPEATSPLEAVVSPGDGNVEAPTHGKIIRARPKVALLWASQMGNVESLTDLFATKLMEAGFDLRLACMADVPVSDLEKSAYLLLMSSTFGDGDPPDNGLDFWLALNAKADLNLKDRHYAVLGLGDDSYDQFCGHARNLDSRMQALGASRLLDRTDCGPEFQAMADTWLQDVIARIKHQEDVLYAGRAQSGHPEAVPGVVPSKRQPAAARLIENVRLNKAGSSKDTRFLSFDVASSALDYEVGDALGIWPKNCPALVQELLAVSGLDGGIAVDVPGVGEIRLVDALTGHFEIAKPNTEALAFVASRNRRSAMPAMLEAGDKARLRAWLWGKQFADILHECPIDLSAPELIAILKPMQPRLYSIASSPNAHRGEVHLTVSVVRYNNLRSERKGVSSTFLADRAGAGEVPVFVQRSAHFRPPRDGNTPMIMVGPGTGIAPFRAFLHERRTRGDTGRNWLFFGEQHAETDFYYRDELETMRRDGLLNRLDLAFSRDQAEKIYVQHRMREHGADLWASLQEGAHFYVCGDAARMAKDVDAALRDVVARHGAMTEEKAAEYVSQLAREKRYLRDVY